MLEIRRVSFALHMCIVTARNVSIFGCVASLLSAGGFIFTLEAQQPAAGPPVPATAHHAHVHRYCVSCHSDRLKTGGLTLNAVATHEVGQDADVWEKVLRKIRARQMPPGGLPGLPRPDEAAYETAISSLETALDRAAAAAPNPGRTSTLRRLTRTEYQNAVRDLLALDIDVASLLPAASPICRLHY